MAGATEQRSNMDMGRARGGEAEHPTRTGGKELEEKNWRKRTGRGKRYYVTRFKAVVDLRLVVFLGSKSGA